jgi:signal transduction histidine kinase
MNGARGTVKQAWLSPLPSNQFGRFLFVFHVVFVLGIFCCLVLRWNQPGFRWSMQEPLLISIVLAQVALYARFFIWPSGWTECKASLVAYFVVAYAIWFVQSRIEPALQWTVWAYMGQMFGSLPPRVSLPGSAIVFALVFGPNFRPHPLSSMRWDDWVGLAGAAIGIVGVTGCGLFLHKLVVTSSERARLIQDLETAQRELRTARQRDAELAALRERERLARDLHDSLGHGLVTLTVQLEAAQRLVGTDPSRASSILGEMKTLTRTSMEQLRRSLAGLRAPGLGDRQLKEGLVAVCEEARRRCGLEVVCAIDNAADQLPPEVAEALWRAAQEALLNVERHAQARAVSLTLKVLSNEVLLRVNDDGVGIPSDAELRPAHYGLRGLRERTEGLGGNFNILPAEPKGAVLNFRIPLIATRI